MSTATEEIQSLMSDALERVVRNVRRLKTHYGLTNQDIATAMGVPAHAATSDIRVVQELLGHESPTTTAIYTAFSQVKAAEAVGALV